MNLHVDDETFRLKLYKYASLTGKSISEVVLEQAKLLAKRLADLTIPKSKAEGNKSVAIDIGKVFLRNDWFENTFQFTNQKLGERVKKLVVEKNEADLTTIFQKSSRLNQLHIEPFDASKHKNARKNGRVSYKHPFSYPLNAQSKVVAYTKAKQKNVGLAKSGWGYCYKLLGGNPPSWLSHAVGEIEDRHTETNSSVTLINKVPHAVVIDGRMNVVGRALAGRARDMIVAAEHALTDGKHKAGF